jgi:hypothetical protein
MKRTFGILSILLGAAFASSPAAAQPEWLVSGVFGSHLPMGDYSEVSQSGWNGGVSLDYRVRRTFGWGIDVMYDAAAADSGDVDFSIFQFGGHWTSYIPSRSGGAFTPFGQFGLAFYNIKAEGTGVSDTEGKLGLNAGAGVQYMKPTSAIGFGADATWHLVFTENESSNFINVNARVIVSFSDRSQR